MVTNGLMRFETRVPVGAIREVKCYITQMQLSAVGQATRSRYIIFRGLVFVES